MSNTYTIGIDLGTTNSAVSIYENGQAKIIENALGKRTTPSIIALKKTKAKGAQPATSEWIVGETAKRQAVTNPLNTLYGVKRLIGRRFDDPAVEKMKALAPYKIVEGPNGDAWVEVDGQPMAPAEISAKVLRELKLAVEKYLGNGAEVTEAVITCPAYFDDSQRKATRDAGKIAGLDVKRVINEPTAAALAYGMDKKKDGKIIVYDLGGGTFDVSVLEVAIDEKEGSMIRVLSTNGDTFLGGENFDERIMAHLVEVLRDETGLDLETTKDVTALGRLKEAAENAKIELSRQEIATVNLPFIGQGEEGPINFEYNLTRAKLEDLVKDLIERTKEPCQKALADAGLSINDIDDIILVGGQTRMPKVVETVKALFGGKAPRNDVNVDEIVSMGASVQGAVLDGKVENVLLLDVIPLSIGIRAAKDTMSIMVPRNSTIPTEVKDVFSTAADNQRDVCVKVYQGERPTASDNKFLGEFTLDGIPPAPAGKPQIEVSFKIDADGVLEVAAKDLATGRAQKITVKANGGLSEEEVERMLNDAEKNADADRLNQERKLAGVKADALLKEAALDENEDYFKQAPADLVEQFRATVTELTNAVSKNDVTVMMDKTEKLSKIRTAIGEAFYNAAAPQAEEAPQAAAPATPKAPEATPPAQP